MAEDWMPVAYASFIVNGLSLTAVPEASGPMFFTDRTVFNDFAGLNRRSNELQAVALPGREISGFRCGQQTHTSPHSNDCGDGTTFASIFDSRLAALKHEGQRDLVAGPYSAAQELSVLFAPGVNAVGFDLFQIDGGFESIAVQLFDMADQLIASTGAQARQKGSFFGAIDETNLIGRISLQANCLGRDDGHRSAGPDLDTACSVANDNPRPGATVQFGLGLTSLGVGWRSSSAVAHLEGR